MNTGSSGKIQIDQEKIDIYKRKLKYFGTKAFLYGCLFSIIFRKPRFFFPLSLGIAAGYCHNDFKDIFYTKSE